MEISYTDKIALRVRKKEGGDVPDIPDCILRRFALQISRLVTNLCFFKVMTRIEAGMAGQNQSRGGVLIDCLKGRQLGNNAGSGKGLLWCACPGTMHTLMEGQ
jgi:hypothetical protein